MVETNNVTIARILFKAVCDCIEANEMEKCDCVEIHEEDVTCDCICHNCLMAANAYDGGNRKNIRTKEL